MLVAGDRWIAQNGLNFWPDYSQLHTESTIIVLILYLVHLKVKVRSPKATIILKYRSCDTCFLVSFGR